MRPSSSSVSAQQQRGRVSFLFCNTLLQGTRHQCLLARIIVLLLVCFAGVCLYQLATILPPSPLPLEGQVLFAADEATQNSTTGTIITTATHTRSTNSILHICKGTATGIGTETLSLASPFFKKNDVLLQPVRTSPCWGTGPLHNDPQELHLFFSIPLTQYGHFVFNGLAPLWHTLLLLPPNSTQQQLVLHMVSGDPSKSDPTGRKNRPYIQRYLSLFGAREVHVYSRNEFERANLGTFDRSPVAIGLIDTPLILDHYNVPANNSALWRAFRTFLMDRLDLPPSSTDIAVSNNNNNNNPIRLTVIQRQDDRKFLNLTAMMDDVVATSSSSSTSNNHRPIVQPRIVTLEGMSVDDQAKVMQQTDVLVGTDGTGLMNGMYLPLGSCVISILPYGVAELIPGKGQNFEVLLNKLGMRYIVVKSLPVPESQEIYELALTKENGSERYFMLHQDVNITSNQLNSAIDACFS